MSTGPGEIGPVVVAWVQPVTAMGIGDVDDVEGETSGTLTSAYRMSSFWAYVYWFVTPLSVALCVTMEGR